MPLDPVVPSDSFSFFLLLGAECHPPKPPVRAGSYVTRRRFAARRGDDGGGLPSSSPVLARMSAHRALEMGGTA